MHILKKLFLYLYICLHVYICIHMFYLDIYVYIYMHVRTLEEQTWNDAYRHTHTHIFTKTISLYLSLSHAHRHAETEKSMGFPRNSGRPPSNTHHCWACFHSRAARTWSPGPHFSRSFYIDMGLFCNSLFTDIAFSRRCLVICKLLWPVELESLNTYL